MDKISKRKSSIYSLIFILPILFITLTIFLNNEFNNLKNDFSKDGNSVDLIQLWNEKKYQEIIDYCGMNLEDDIYNTDLLRFYGFSNFYLAISQISLEMRIPLLNESIKALRKAYVLADDVYKKNIAYVLGKAYYYKGDGFNKNNYADLSINYLNIALDRGYSGKDIYEFKALAYYDLGEYRLSIQEFELLSKEKHTPEMKYIISKSYSKLNNYEKQEEYLMEILSGSVERNLKLDIYLDLAQLSFNRGEYSKTIEYSTTVLKGRADSIEARFLLGKSYSLTGQSREARNIFRKLLKQKPGDKEFLEWLNK